MDQTAPIASRLAPTINSPHGPIGYQLPLRRSLWHLFTASWLGWTNMSVSEISKIKKGTQHSGMKSDRDFIGTGSHTVRAKDGPYNWKKAILHNRFSRGGFLPSLRDNFSCIRAIFNNQEFVSGSNSRNFPLCTHPVSCSARPLLKVSPLHKEQGSLRTRAYPTVRNRLSRELRHK
jgi:hypothetical protein